MRILAVEPYYGGSHKAFIDGWRRHSRHEFELVTFPAYKWKWRMRHSAVSAAGVVRQSARQGHEWDLLFASDMLGLAEFCGLAGEAVAGIPRVAYFHENQLLYPDPSRRERDLHFAYMNFTTALAADRVWFNTAWHREVFLEACREFLGRMPDYKHLEEVSEIEERSEVFGQGIIDPGVSLEQRSGDTPLRLVWAARWEHDKNPEDLYRLLGLLRESGLEFSISIIGESFKDVPEAFTRIRREFSGYIDRFGYQPTRKDYILALREADIIISTAVHEFFGVSIIEGCACGAVPLAPERLAYPEVLAHTEEFLYAGTPESLKERILWFAGMRGSAEWQGYREQAQRLAGRFYWDKTAVEMDTAVEEMINDRGGAGARV